MADLQLRRADRRQGREHRRPSARRRHASDHRPVLHGTCAQGRRRWCSGRRFIAVCAAGKIRWPIRRAPMKPAAFDYLRAETAEYVLEGLAQEGSNARVLAGGQSLMAMLNMRLAKPKLLIDIMRI